MPKKLMFFNIFVQKNGKLTDYPIYRLLDDLYGLEVGKRFKIIDSRNYKINAIEADDNKNTYNRDIWFCKYREDKPFIGDFKNDDTDPIDSDVIEPTLFTYIATSNLLVMVYNHYGPSYKVLEKYLNKFFNDENITVKIIPIKTKDQIELIKNADHIKTIDIEYVVDDYDYTKLLKGDYADAGIVAEALELNKKIADKFDSKIGVLSLKKGRFKEPINMSEALSLFSHLDGENDMIRDIRVGVKDAYGKPKTINLKNNGLEYEYIEIEGNAFDVMRMTTREEFYNILNQPHANEFTNHKLLEYKYENLIVKNSEQ